MAETTGKKEPNKDAKKAPKTNYLKGLKTEFKKIIWPNQETIAKETVTVVAATAVIGLVIAVLDFIIKWGLSFII